MEAINNTASFILKPMDDHSFAALTAFKHKYPLVFETQLKRAAKLAQVDHGKVHLVRVGGLEIPGVIPAELFNGRVVLGGASLCVDAFVCVTMCLTLSYLWADLEFGDFDAYTEDKRSLLEKYQIRVNQEPVEFDIEGLKEELAKLYRLVEAECWTFRPRETRLITRILD